MTARTQALDMLRGVARKDANGRIIHQFATDPGRLERMGVEAAGLYLDLSKQAWSAEGFEAALDLARTCDVEGRRNALFGGEAQFGRFLATMQDEGRAAQTYASVAGNSATAGRLADDAATGDGGLIDAASKAVVSVGTGGGIIPTIINAIRDASRYGVGEAGKVTRAEIAAALSETDPAILRAALARAVRARANVRAGIRTNATGEAQGRIGGQGARAILSVNAPKTAEPTE